MKVLRVLGEYQVFFVWAWTLHINGSELEWPQFAVWVGAVIISMAIFYVAVRAK